MIDLFAGCGGLSLGFESANFTPVFVNELNKDAMATYLQNRHHERGCYSGKTWTSGATMPMNFKETTNN